MSPQKALKTLQKGEPLSRVFVEQLPLDKHSFTEAVRINDCVIQSLSGRGSSFEKGLKADTCTFLDTVSLGAGQVQGESESVAGAVASKEISFFRSKFFEGANLEGVSVEGQLYFSNVEVNQRLDLSGVDISGTVNLGNSRIYGLVSRNSSIGGLLILRNSHFDHHFYLNSLVQKGMLQGENTEFRGEAYVGESSFAQEVNFSGATFHDEVVIDSTEFIEGFEFEGARVKGDVLFTDIEFNAWVSMDWTKWTAPATFKNVSTAGDFSLQDAQFAQTFTVEISSFQSDTNFARTQFEGDALFQVANFVGRTGFRDTVFRGRFILDRVSAMDNVYFSRAFFEGLVEIVKAKVEGKMYFPRVDFSKGLDVSRSNFGNGLDLSNIFAGSNVSLSFCDIDGHFDLTESETRGTVQLADSSFAGTLSFTEAKSDSIDIRASQIKNRMASEIDKHWGMASKEWELLKDSFQRQNRSNDADFASFKLRQLDNRTPATGPAKLSKMFERVFIEWGTGYGTKPENVFFMSFIAIILFATAFSYFSADVVDPGSRSFADYVKFSFAIFSTLGTSNMIVALEAFVGGFLMAMFTALLTRRIFRD
jgi:hypothetical protein